MTFTISPLAPITASFPLPTIPPHARQQLQRAYQIAITVLCWAIAITYTAGRLACDAYVHLRPHIAKAFHALALVLDGGLEYPDQPEPEPAVDPFALSSKRPTTVVEMRRLVRQIHGPGFTHNGRRVSCLRKDELNYLLTVDSLVNA
jgi:hypothetical protein